MITWSKWKGFNNRAVTSNCRASGKHGGAENKDVRTQTVLWPSSTTSEQDQGGWWASGYSRGEDQVWMTEWNKRSTCCGWDYSVREWHAVLLICVPASDWRRHWKHGEVHMCYFPKDTGGMYANSKPYLQSGYGNAESPRIAAGSRCQTSKGFSQHFCFSWHNPATILTEEKKKKSLFLLNKYTLTVAVITLRLKVSIISVKMLEKSRLYFITNAEM